MKTHDIVRIVAIFLLALWTGYNILFPGFFTADVWVMVSSMLSGIAGLASPIPKLLAEPAGKKCQYEDICREREFIEIKKSMTECER